MKQSVKLILSVILIACLTIPYALSPVLASNFTDTKAHWAKDKIEKWTSLEILSGSNNKFRPNDYITRGEIAVILNKIMKYQSKAENSFMDLDEKFYTEAILKANFAGVIAGNDKKIYPTDKATREEAAVMFVKALSIKSNENKDYQKFKDSSQISSWAIESVNAMAGNGYVVGDSKKKFNPKSKITRGEIVAIIDNCIEALYGKEGTYSENTTNGNVVINTPEVTLKDMQINGNIIIAQGVGEGSLHLDNVKISGDILVKGGGSIYFNNASVAGSLIVNKADGQIKIVSSGTTAIERALLESGASIEAADQVSGGINSVEISSKVPTGQKVILQGIFKLVKNDAINMCIEAVGTIDNLILNQKTLVKGGANIKRITTAKGADSVINGIFVAGGQTNISLADQTATGSSDTVTKSSGNNPNNSPGGNNNTKHYTVTFQANGGTATTPIEVIEGSRLTLPAAPTYTGYIFMGWYTDTELTNE
ncbi:MAG: S-layer homology domain-containing protein, partial [Ruminiclostridium sp.]